MPDLIAALQDKSWNVRLNNTEALGDIGAEAQDTVPELVKMLANEAQDDILIASVERMQRALELRNAVAGAMRKMRPDATRSLTEMLRDKDARIRTITAQLLGEVGPEAEAAIPALESLLEDENEQVRQAAAGALKAIDQREE